MFFLIGVIILIVFIMSVYLYIKVKLRRILDETGFSNQSIWDIIREARVRQQSVPKMISSMDKIYLNQITEDFPDINLNELKRKSEKVILDCFNAIEAKDSKNLTGKFKSFVDDIINDYEGKKVKFDEFKFHRTSLSEYKKDKGIVSLYFSSAFEYILDIDGKRKKVQDRAKVEFIYIIDEGKLSEYQNAIDFHCPNCNSPITNLGQKKCSYCGTAVVQVVGRTFFCNDIVRY